jgi:hypothetical protein
LPDRSNGYLKNLREGVDRDQVRPVTVPRGSLRPPAVAAATLPPGCDLAKPPALTERIGA